MLTPHATANSLQIRAKARPQTITRRTGRTRAVTDASKATCESRLRVRSLSISYLFSVRYT